jgi:hypothetical protein
MYNLKFTLGDPSCDGHGRTREFHIQTNHSREDIYSAYVDFSAQYGFKYLDMVGDEYECFGGIPEDITNKLFELGILEDKDRIIHFDETGERYKYDRYGFSKDYDLRHDGCYEFGDCEEEFLDIFFKMIKHQIPDFEWKIRDLEEETLSILHGRGYGFVCYP